MWINAAGKGKVRYTRRFGSGETDVWVTATLAGATIEREIWGSCHADGGDMLAIERMVEDMGIHPWSDTILNGCRLAAEKFVRERRDIIEIVPEELLRVRQMTGSELDELLLSLSQIEV